MSRSLLVLLSLSVGCGSADVAPPDTGCDDCTATTTDLPATTTTGTSSPTTVTAALLPPKNDSSDGSGGSDLPGSALLSATGTDFLLLAPNGSAAGNGLCFMLVISGTEGRDLMMANMLGVAAYSGVGDCLIAVLDGRFDTASDLEATLDGVRALYDVHNDRTWLLTESAGTTEGLQVGFHSRQSYFAAVWANDVNIQDGPEQTAAQLGFEPWGNVGPGGDFVDADAIVSAMSNAGYRLPNDAPYSGPGAGVHGSPEQFIEAVSFFQGKTR